MNSLAPTEYPHKLSVLLVTYNHAAYIKQALDGLLAQQHSLGEIELVVADDSSTDETRDIIRETLSHAHGITVRFLPADVNLGIVKNYQRGFAACSGAYVAVLEGDDYWIRRSKLQEQVDFLDQYPGLPACGANYFVKHEEASSFRLRKAKAQGHSFLDAPALIADNVLGNFSNMVYRSEALRTLPSAMYELRAYDWLTNILLAAEGPIGFLHQVCGVYRVHSGGSWSGLEERTKLQQQLVDVDIYDKFTSGRFHHQFAAVKRSLETRLGGVEKHKWRSARYLAAKSPLFLPPFVRYLIKAVVPPAFWIAMTKFRKWRA